MPIKCIYKLVWHDSWKSITLTITQCVLCVPALLASKHQTAHSPLQYMPYEEITSALRCSTRGKCWLVFNWFPQLWFWAFRKSVHRHAQCHIHKQISVLFREQRDALILSPCHGILFKSDCKPHLFQDSTISVNYKNRSENNCQSEWDSMNSK